MPRRGRKLRLLAPLAASVLGCGGGVPLFHPAHVLRPGTVSLGAGLSGQVALERLPGATEPAAMAALHDVSVAPGVAPWVGARVGLIGENEAGLAYTGRSLRVDARHAFDLGAPTLSVGLGATAIMARRPGDANGSAVYGGGLDLPILIGAHSRSDLYAVWFGPRAGAELLSGQLALASAQPTDPNAMAGAAADVKATHVYGGLVAGLRVGFRHVHAALELDAAFHHAAGTVGASSLSLEQWTLAPGGALIVSF